MAETVRVRRHLDSETVYLPEAKELVGRDVEIMVREIGAAERPSELFPLRASVIKYEDPFEPVAEEDWEATA
jgi:hypothetical protein